jgi:hypothetical protein
MIAPENFTARMESPSPLEGEGREGGIARSASRIIDYGPVGAASVGALSPLPSLPLKGGGGGLFRWQRAS